MTDSNLVDRFIQALETGDEAAVRDCYAPDAVIWHNFDGIEQSVDDNVASLHWLRGVMDDIRYESIRRAELEGGILQQHDMVGSIGGKPVTVPSCVVFHIENGVIARLEEYLDPAPLLKRLA